MFGHRFNRNVVAIFYDIKDPIVGTDHFPVVKIVTDPATDGL